MQRSIEPEMEIFALRHFRICGTAFKQIAEKKLILSIIFRKKGFLVYLFKILETSDLNS